MAQIMLNIQAARKENKMPKTITINGKEIDFERAVELMDYISEEHIVAGTMKENPPRTYYDDVLNALIEDAGK